MAYTVGKITLIKVFGKNESFIFYNIEKNLTILEKLQFCLHLLTLKL